MRNMAKFNLMGIVFTMAILWIGGFIVGSFLLPMLPSITGWMAGIFTGIIQMALLAFLGMTTGKMHLTSILIGGLIIFAGGFIGGILVSIFGLTDIFATITILLIQTIMLSFTGYAAKGKGPHI